MVREAQDFEACGFLQTAREAMRLPWYIGGQLAGVLGIELEKARRIVIFKVGIAMPRYGPLTDAVDEYQSVGLT
jgi:hypothetical protein